MTSEDLAKCKICNNLGLLRNFKKHIEKKHPEILGCLLSEVCNIQIPLLQDCENKIG